MADITREEAIEEIKVYKNDWCEDRFLEEALDMAISDVKRVEQLEAYFEDKDIAKRILTDDKEFSAWLDRIKFHVKKADEYARKCEKLEAENKRLTDLLYEQSKNLDSLNLEVERLKDAKES